MKTAIGAYEAKTKLPELLRGMQAGKRTPHQLEREYSSDEHLIGNQPIAELITRADREFEALEIAGGEYAKF